MGLDTKIIKIRSFLAILWTKRCFTAAILNFSFFGEKHWRDFVVPAIFVSSVVRSTILPIFMLLSGSARLIHISAPPLCTKQRTERPNKMAFINDMVLNNY